MSSPPSGASNTGGSAAVQAEEMTRNILLGIPKGGLAQDSPEAADLRAAEAFVSDIQQEILAYDIANAQAMENTARTWWSRVPYFGRHARRALEEERHYQEQLKQYNEQISRMGADAGTSSSGGGAASSPPHSQWHGSLSGLDAATAAAAGSAPFLHTQSGRTASGMKVERTAAVDAAQLSSESAAGAHGGIKPPQKPTPNAWLFKRQNPGWVPLMQRWWVPWICVTAVVLVWTPDVWKLRALYYSDHQYALFRQSIHKAYWRATMSKEDYDALMADIEAQRPTAVKSTDCPF